MNDIEVKLHDFETILIDHVNQDKLGGMGIAVIKAGEVVYSRCFGYADKEKKLPMTYDTLIDIASLSKAFTATLLAIIIEEQDFDWNTPIREYFPQMRFNHEFANKTLTLKDILSHRTGLPMHEQSWFLDENLSPQKLLERLPYLEFSAEPRSKFMYTNVLYQCVIAIIEYYSGKEFPQFIRDNLFTPLKMDNTVVTFNEALESGNFAKPYKISNGKLEEIDYFDQDIFGSTGVKSSLHDLTYWLQFHMGNGQFEGKEIISTKNMKILHQPTIVMPEGGLAGIIYPTEHYSELPSYALGWSIEMHRGHKLVAHSGKIDGFTSMISFMPHEELGIIILSNEDTLLKNEFIALEMYDILLGLEPLDWFSKSNELIRRIREQNNNGRDNIIEMRVPNTQPSLELQGYIGTYQNPGYPHIKIVYDNGHLLLDTPRLRFKLEHIHFDTFLLSMPISDLFIKLNFIFNTKGEISKFSAQFEESLPPIEFNKIIEDPPEEDLLKFTGIYDYFGDELIIKVVNHALTGDSGYNSTFILESSGKNKFRPKNSTGTEFVFVNPGNNRYDIKIVTIGQIIDVPRLGDLD